MPPRLPASVGVCGRLLSASFSSASTASFSLAARSLAMAVLRFPPLVLPSVVTAAPQRHKDPDASPVCLASPSGRPAKSLPSSGRRIGLRDSTFFKGGSRLLCQRRVAVCVRRMEGRELEVQSSQNSLQDAARKTVRCFSCFSGNGRRTVFHCNVVFLEDYWIGFPNVPFDFPVALCVTGIRFM